MEIASHYRQLLRELDEQRQHGVLCDACVVVEGKVFRAHKNVLLGSSRYFKTLYCQVQKTSTEQATVTHLDIVTAQGFKAIIDFMYSAHLALTSRNVIEVMSAASFLQMTDIVQACHDFIKAALDISIKPDASDELSEFEMGAGPGGGTDALISAVMAGRSISPWLARRTSPTNSSGDSAIASCHEGGSSYGKEDSEPKVDGAEDLGSAQALWPGDVVCGALPIKEEQVSPVAPYQESELPCTRDAGAQNPFSEQAGGDSWQPSGRRKNRKNKETVRHITQQADDDSQPSSPGVPSFLPAAAWSFSSRDSGESLPGSGHVGAQLRSWHHHFWQFHPLPPGLPPTSSVCGFSEAVGGWCSRSSGLPGQAPPVPGMGVEQPGTSTALVTPGFHFLPWWFRGRSQASQSSKLCPCPGLMTCNSSSMQL